MSTDSPAPMRPRPAPGLDRCGDDRAGFSSIPDFDCKPVIPEGECAAGSITVSHAIEKLDKSNLLFKIFFLRDAARSLNYDYLVWLDADTYFVRNPGNVLRVLHASPVHTTFESDACAPNNRRSAWWECSLSRFARLMQVKGVRNKSIFNVNAGFWIVHHDVIDTFCALALDFWELWKRDGHDPFPEEPAMAYAAQMLCGNPYLHTLPKSSDLWASDWTGCWKDQLPDGRPWMFEDYFNGERSLVNPAIVAAYTTAAAQQA